MAGNGGPLDAERVEQQPGIIGQDRGSVAAQGRVGRAMAALVGNDQAMGREIGRDDRPAAAAVGVAVEQEQRRAGRVAHLDVGEADSVR